MFGKCIDARISGSRRSKHRGCSYPQWRPLNEQKCCPRRKFGNHTYVCPGSPKSFPLFALVTSRFVRMFHYKLRCNSLHSQTSKTGTGVQLIFVINAVWVVRSTHCVRHSVAFKTMTSEGQTTSSSSLADILVRWRTWLLASVSPKTKNAYILLCLKQLPLHTTSRKRCFLG